MLSRDDPPAELSRHIANDQIRIIGWQHMRLTISESRAILALRRKSSWSGVQVGDPQSIHKLAGGWAAGLVLLSEQAQEPAAQPTTERGFDARRVFDYFAQEVFQRMAPPTRMFLTKTAL